MPRYYNQKRKYQRKRRYYRRRRPVPQNQKSMLARAWNHKFSVAQIASAVGKLKGLVNSEMKHSDYDINSSITSSSTNCTPITAITQGDSESTRDGNSILAKSLEAKMITVMPGTTSGLNVKCRAMIVRDNMPDGSTITATDILQSADVNSFYNKTTNVGRFGKLYDETFVLNNEAHPVKVVDLKVPLQSHIKYNASTANQADLAKGNLYVLGFTDNADASPIDWHFRLKYHDN